MKKILTFLVLVILFSCEKESDRGVECRDCTEFARNTRNGALVYYKEFQDCRDDWENFQTTDIKNDTLMVTTSCPPK